MVEPIKKAMMSVKEVTVILMPATRRARAMRSLGSGSYAALS